MVSLNLGVTLLRSGDPDAAVPLLGSAAQILSAAVPEGHWILAQARLSQGEALLDLDRTDEAGDLIRTARDQLVAHFGPEHWRSEAAEGLVVRLDESLAAAPTEP